MRFRLSLEPVVFRGGRGVLSGRLEMPLTWFRLELGPSWGDVGAHRSWLLRLPSVYREALVTKLVHPLLAILLGLYLDSCPLPFQVVDEKDSGFVLFFTSDAASGMQDISFSNRGSLIFKNRCLPVVYMSSTPHHVRISAWFYRHFPRLKNI